MIDKNIEKILNQAFAEANQARYEFFTTEHVLLALARGDEMTYQGLADCGADIDELCQNITEHLEGNCPKLSNDEETTVPTSAFHRVVERANNQRKSAGKTIANGLHLLIAIMDEAESHAVYFLKKQNVSKLDLMQFISSQEQGESDIQSDNEETAEEENAVEKYCINLNELAKIGKIDPLIGREAELKRVIQVLARRRKNNPILVGEAGVGKTAIAEGLAKKIVDGEVPDILKDTVIYNVDLGGMVAGSKYRGDFEKRIKDLLNTLKSIPNSIIFIDEIHTLLGAGSTSESTMDASNLLKPALSSGELKCIGATTYKEFKQTFEKNAALARRFQKVDVKEPTLEETYHILKGLQSRFEAFHGVKYSDEAIHAAVDLSDKYLNERFLPDKAIDLIDEAGAHTKLLQSKKALITARQIEAVVASIAKIPEKTVSKDDKKSLKGLEKNLKKKIFGQDQAIQATTKAIKLARAGLKDLEKPIGAFLFTGPTGVGKTEVSKQLANELGVQFIRFDMSEYMEAHTVSRLIGSPPGYVGFDQGGLLTDAISKTPHCVLLLDEIEKAHPDIFNLLLQIMDYGKLTDSNGKTIVFNNVILIMTSNVGADMLEKNSIGFQLNINANEDNSSAIKRTFSPEFRNRLTAVIKFAPLDKDSILKVINKLLGDLSVALEKQNIKLKVSAPAKQWLLSKGYNRLMGARPMSRLIESEIKAPLSELILFGELANGGEVSVGVNKKADTLVIKPLKKALVKL